MPVEYVAHTLVHMASFPLNVNILNQVREETREGWVARHRRS